MTYCVPKVLRTIPAFHHIFKWDDKKVTDLSLCSSTIHNHYCHSLHCTGWDDCHLLCSWHHCSISWTHLTTAHGASMRDFSTSSASSEPNTASANQSPYTCMSFPSSELTQQILPVYHVIKQTDRLIQIHPTHPKTLRGLGGGGGGINKNIN